jgi:hypothetical protein
MGIRAMQELLALDPDSLSLPLLSGWFLSVCFLLHSSVRMPSWACKQSQRVSLLADYPPEYPAGDIVSSLTTLKHRAPASRCPSAAKF